MNSPLPVASIYARFILALVLTTSVSALLITAKSGSVFAPQEQAGPKASPVEREPTRRLFENRIPEHLPIKVKIKREKEKLFRDLNNEKWARDFEIEVKNVGEKPIYELFFQLEVPEARIANSYQVFSIVYGRVELYDTNKRPNAEDVPIMPGETMVLTIDGVGVRGWDEARARGLVPPRIHGVRLLFQSLMFGDGTGFDGSTGAPRSKKKSETNGSACGRANDDYGGLGIMVDGANDRAPWNPRDAGIFKPASFFR